MHLEHQSAWHGARRRAGFVFGIAALTAWSLLAGGCESARGRRHTEGDASTHESDGGFGGADDGSSLTNDDATVMTATDGAAEVGDASDRPADTDAGGVAVDAGVDAWVGVVEDAGGSMPVEDAGGPMLLDDAGGPMPADAGSTGAADAGSAQRLGALCSTGGPACPVLGGGGRCFESLSVAPAGMSLIDTPAYCSSACTSGSECGPEGDCVSTPVGESILGPAARSCLRRCNEDSDCPTVTDPTRAPMRCTRFTPSIDAQKHCFPAIRTSLTGVGNACLRPSDCPGTRFCYAYIGATAFPGGYCSAWCLDDRDCGSGARCVIPSAGTHPICAKTCTTSSECRVSEGYVCSENGGLGLARDARDRTRYCLPM